MAALKTRKTQGYGNHDKRADGMVNHHLVDDDLGAYRHSETDQLDSERGQQDFSPDLAVLEQLGDEPAEAELAWSGIVVGHGFGVLFGEQHVAIVAGAEFGEGQGLRGLLAGFEYQQALAVGLQDEGEAMAGLRGRIGGLSALICYGGCRLEYRDAWQYGIG
jgi:hypothetical protein